MEAQLCNKVDQIPISFTGSSILEMLNAGKYLYIVYSQLSFIHAAMDGVLEYPRRVRTRKAPAVESSEGCS